LAIRAPSTAAVEFLILYNLCEHVDQKHPRPQRNRVKENYAETGSAGEAAVGALRRDVG
jgi:hypothetical protein